MAPVKRKRVLPYKDRDFDRMYARIESLRMVDEKGNPLYTEEELRELAKTMVKVAHEVKKFGPGIILVPERGAVPIAKMLQIAIYELGKVDSEFNTLHPEYIHFPNTAETKYAFNWYVLDKILGRKKFKKVTDQMIGEIKDKMVRLDEHKRMTPKKREYYKELIQKLRQLSPNYRKIMLIDEVNTGVSFLTNYGLTYEKLRNLFFQKKLPKFEFRGVGIAHNYGANVYKDKERINKAIIQIAKFYEGRERRLIRQRDHYIKKIKEFQTKLEKAKNPDKRRELQKKLENAQKEYNAILNELSTIKNQQLSFFYDYPKLSSFILSLNLEGLSRFDEGEPKEIRAVRSKQGEPGGSIVIFPTKSVVSMDKPKLLGVSFIKRAGKGEPPRILGVNAKRNMVSTDLFWHPDLAVYFKRFMKDYSDVLKKLISEEYAKKSGNVVERGGKGKRRNNNHKRGR